MLDFFGFLNSPFLSVWVRIGFQCSTRLGSYTRTCCLQNLCIGGHPRTPNFLSDWMGRGNAHSKLKKQSASESLALAMRMAPALAPPGVTRVERRKYNACLWVRARARTGAWARLRARARARARAYARARAPKLMCGRARKIICSKIAKLKLLNLMGNRGHGFETANEPVLGADHERYRWYVTRSFHTPSNLQ